MTVTPDQAIAQIREALEKVEVCEWFVDPKPTNSGLTRVDDGKSSGIFPIRGETFEMEYVAACNPQNMSVLLAEIDALQHDIERHVDIAAALASQAQSGETVETPAPSSLLVGSAEPDGWICEDEFTLEADQRDEWVEEGLEPKPFYFAPPAPQTQMQWTHVKRSPEAAGANLYKLRGAPIPSPAPREVVACDCTKVAQDETCPVGYPSLLCDECDGKGVVPAPSTPNSGETR